MCFFIQFPNCCFSGGFSAIYSTRRKFPLFSPTIISNNILISYSQDGILHSQELSALLKRIPSVRQIGSYLCRDNRAAQHDICSNFILGKNFFNSSNTKYISSSSHSSPASSMHFSSDARVSNATSPI